MTWLIKPNVYSLTANEKKTDTFVILNGLTMSVRQYYA